MQRVLLNKKLHVLLELNYYKLFHYEFHYFNIQVKDYESNKMLPMYLDPNRLNFRLNHELFL